MWMSGEFVGLAHPVWGTPSGYGSSTQRRMFVSLVAGKEQWVGGYSAPFEQQVAELGIVCGTPKTVVKKLKTILDTTLTLLEVAKTAYENPSTAGPANEKNEVAGALIEKLLSEALVASWEGKRDEAVRLWSAVIDTKGVPAKDRAAALYNRGVVAAERGDTSKAIADYSSVIDMPDAPAKQQARALVNRGFTLGVSGDTTKAIADYSAVIDMPDAPAEERSMALYNRGVRLGASGDNPKAIADYSAAIDMPDASAKQKAMALYNRGCRWGASGDTAKEIADYSAVIDMPDAPAEQKSMALHNRGFRWGANGDTPKAIADYSAVIDMPDASTEQKAMALASRGWRRFFAMGDAQAMIDDSRKALDMMDGNLTARANLALGLLLTGHPEEARAEYEAFLARTPDAKALQSAIDDLESRKVGVAEAEEILELLRAALEKFSPEHSP
jgi:tetratricopeptide (TPR) repeat protein